MGAMEFSSKVLIQDQHGIDGAFKTAQDTASFEHGHGGYTGTIAEKSGMTMFPNDGRDLEPLGLDPETVIAGLGGDEEAAEQLKNTLGISVEKLRRYQNKFEDKWEDAIGFLCGDAYYFCGWASS